MLIFGMSFVRCVRGHLQFVIQSSHPITINMGSLPPWCVVNAKTWELWNESDGHLLQTFWAGWTTPDIRRSVIRVRKRELRLSLTTGAMEDLLSLRREPPPPSFSTPVRTAGQIVVFSTASHNFLISFVNEFYFWLKWTQNRKYSCWSHTRNFGTSFAEQTSMTCRWIFLVHAHWRLNVFDVAVFVLAIKLTENNEVSLLPEIFWPYPDRRASREHMKDSPLPFRFLQHTVCQRPSVKMSCRRQIVMTMSPWFELICTSDQLANWLLFPFPTCLHYPATSLCCKAVLRAFLLNTRSLDPEKSRKKCHQLQSMDGKFASLVHLKPSKSLRS